MHSANKTIPALACLAFLALAPSTHAANQVSGQDIALNGTGDTPACAACHGAHGEGKTGGTFPRLAGQPVGYQVSQLQDFANGSRKNAVMAPMASNLSEAQMKAVARYYSKQSVASSYEGNASKATLAKGRELAMNGDWSQQIPACVACHGEGARGVAPHFPALAGQYANYIQTQLEAWQNDKRPPGPGHLMKSIADRLSSDQIHAVSLYLASLPATGDLPENAHPDAAPTSNDAVSGSFQPPLSKDIPDNEFGDSVRRGEKIFTQTHRYAENYIGGGLDCANCHLNKGRQTGAAPMWAAWVLYPRYRGKNDKINTMADRIRGCFTFSENAQDSEVGHPPASNSTVVADLESYFRWLATNAPTGKKMKGQGYPSLKDPAKAFDPERGSEVYAAHCAVCHGESGEGTKARNGGYIFPPLWGSDSFNWGAGMHRVSTAAAFIHANMPLGLGGSLGVQQAWDVASYIDSKPRPQDPRFNGDLKKAIQKYHANRGNDYYGKTVNGLTLGAPENYESD